MSYFLSASSSRHKDGAGEKAVPPCAAPAVPFPPGTPSPSSVAAWVTSTDKLVAVLAGGSSKSSPSGDGGAGDAGAQEGATGDGGSSRPVLRLNVVSPQSDLTKLPPAFEFPGTWASVASQGTRLVVATSGTTSSRPVAFYLFDVGNREPKVSGGFNTSESGSVSYADVAFNSRARLFFAVVQPEAVSLVVYDQAAGEGTRRL
jgi:hypothetical protein